MVCIPTAISSHHICAENVNRICREMLSFTIVVRGRKGNDGGTVHPVPQLLSGLCTTPACCLLVLQLSLQ